MNRTTLVLLCAAELSVTAFGQSSLVSDAGTTIEVTGSADLCADIMTINGAFSGDGTKCGSPLPVTLTSFAARGDSRGLSVVLTWNTLSETNSYGFYVQARRSNETGFTDVAGSFVAGHGTTLTPHAYGCTVALTVGSQTSVRLKQVDLDGGVHFSEAVVLSAAGVSENAPVVFALDQNYPNPFNPSTEFRFSVDAPGIATLVIYNVLGQEIGRIFEAQTEPGRYYTAHFDGRGLASGVYCARLQAGGTSRMRKMVLSK